jgi:hypothetical protein
MKGKIKQFTKCESFPKERVKVGFWAEQTHKEQILRHEEPSLPNLPVTHSGEKLFEKYEEFTASFMKIVMLCKEYSESLINSIGGFSNLRWVYYLGYSNCRFNCGEHTTNMGCRTIKIVYNNKTFIFPEGYIHYVTNHNITPPSEFIDAVIGFKADPRDILNWPDALKSNVLVSINVICISEGSSILGYS